MKKFARDSTPVFLAKPYRGFSNSNIVVKKQTKTNKKNPKPQNTNPEALLATTSRSSKLVQ